METKLGTFNDNKFLGTAKVNAIQKNTKTYRSPLFYVGDKFKLIPQIKNYFPKNINKFIEPFTGGGSVLLNVDAKEYFLNDIDKYVCQIHRFLMESAKNTTDFFNKIDEIINKYGLSKSYREDIVPNGLKHQYKKTYYAKFNKLAFSKLRNDFNKNQKNSLMLYILLIFGFNRMLRFNSNGEYNVSVGNVDFNKNVVDSLNNYFEWIQNKFIRYFNLDCIEFLEAIKISGDDFIYLDPPYLITFSEYNKRWNEKKEYELLTFLDKINRRGFRFAISNVTHYKDNENSIFAEWIKKYKVYPIKSNYISFNDNSIKNFREVLVTNYKKQL